MADFNFITVTELRHCLESDYRELRVCVEAGAWKAAHVLAGSVIQAVLIDAAKLQSLRDRFLTCPEGARADESLDTSQPTVAEQGHGLLSTGREKTRSGNNRYDQGRNDGSHYGSRTCP